MTIPGKAAFCLAALALVGACARPHEATGRPALPFIENDYARALDKARAANLPLFVEVWAPW